VVAIGRSRTAYEPSFGNDVEILDEIGAKFFSWCQRLSTPISTMEPILVIALRAPMVRKGPSASRCVN
jgi:hypothetical protein